MKIPKKILLGSIIAISSLVGAVYALGLLTQSFPAVTIPSVAAITITSTCSPGTSGTGSLVLETTPTTDSGQLAYDCGGTNPAFTVTVPTFETSGHTSTPTFTIVTTPATGPAVTLFLSSGNCIGNTQIVSGQPITFQPGTTNLDYCLAYSGFGAAGGSIPTFTITWA